MEVLYAETDARDQCYSRPRNHVVLMTNMPEHGWLRGRCKRFARLKVSYATISLSPKGNEADATNAAKRALDTLEPLDIDSAFVPSVWRTDERTRAW